MAPFFLDMDREGCSITVDLVRLRDFQAYGIERAEPTLGGAVATQD